MVHGFSSDAGYGWDQIGKGKRKIFMHRAFDATSYIIFVTSKSIR
jgi:hypothetical protein